MDEPISADLRKVAEELRKVANDEKAVTIKKALHVINGINGLNILTEKLRGQ